MTARVWAKTTRWATLLRRRHVLKPRARGSRLFSASVFLAAALLFSMQPALGQFVQQGPKLVGAGGAGAQGDSVALSADGNTAIVGGPADGGNINICCGFIGAAWVYTRSGGVWTQQGGKLVGTGAAGNAGQGSSVALSADGNTAIVGGAADGGFSFGFGPGAVWVYTRSGGVWTQQGSKLVGTGAVGNAGQGSSVALSADGNTAIVGGPSDNGGIGGAWVFTRSGSVWTQQGTNLVGTGAVGNAGQGSSVALSADGNTAIVGGSGDNHDFGAAWVFTRSGGIWTQQGGKLVGTNAIGSAQQGFSVALSGDSNTAIVGGSGDNNSLGAAWVFTRGGSVWTQQGSKLVGTGAVGAAAQGSVALSADGSTAIVGGFGDNSQRGSAWVFTRSGGVWTQQGSKLVGTGAVLAARQGFSVALSGDANTVLVGGPGDDVVPFTVPAKSIGAAWVFLLNLQPRPTARGLQRRPHADILWRRATDGALSAWLMNGGTVLSGVGIGTVGLDWTLSGAGDLNADFSPDIVWRHASDGAVSAWLMNGVTVVSGVGIGAVGTEWALADVGDLNGDGRADILWRRTSDGAVSAWLMNGATVLAAVGVGTVGPEWTLAALGDLNGDGRADILWRRTSDGAVSAWLMNGGTAISAIGIGTVGTEWRLTAVGDLNGDGRADILWRRASDGALSVWLMNGGTVLAAVGIGTVGAEWRLAGIGDLNGDNRADILWRRATDGAVSAWLMDGATILSAVGIGTLGTEWDSCYP